MTSKTYIIKEYRNKELFFYTSPLASLHEAFSRVLFYEDLQEPQDWIPLKTGEWKFMLPGEGNYYIISEFIKDAANE